MNVGESLGVAIVEHVQKRRKEKLLLGIDGKLVDTPTGLKLRTPRSAELAPASQVITAYSLFMRRAAST